MNIAALMGAAGILPEQPGGSTPVGSIESEFKQLLQELILGPDLQNGPPVGDVQPAEPSNWLGMFLQLFDGATITMQTPDPTGEASATVDNETAVSLTEIMTALQPLVNQSDTDLSLHLAASTPETVATGSEENTDDLLPASTLAQLSAMVSATVPAQPPVAAGTAANIASTVQSPFTNSSPTQPAPVPNMAQTPVTGNSAAGSAFEVTTATGQPATPVTSPVEGDTVTLQNRATETTPAQSSPESPATSPTRTSSPFAPTAPPTRATDSIPTPTSTTPQPQLVPEPAPTTTSSSQQPFQIQFSQSQSQPQFQSPAPSQTPSATSDQTASLVADVAPPLDMTQGLTSAATPTSPATPQAPDLPALHQIVNSVKLIQQQGHSEVRLQLYPKELGQVLVQLHIADGDVSVQLLAENARAHALISEHLPQLKAALNAQGLQVSQANINLGNDASAFNTPGHHAPDDQPNGFGFQQSQRRFAEESAQPPLVGTTKPNSTSSMYSIDFQA